MGFGGWVLALVAVVHRAWRFTEILIASSLFGLKLV